MEQLRQALESLCIASIFCCLGQFVFQVTYALHQPPEHEGHCRSLLQISDSQSTLALLRSFVLWQIGDLKGEAKVPCIGARCDYRCMPPLSSNGLYFVEAAYLLVELQCQAWPRKTESHYIAES